MKAWKREKQLEPRGAFKRATLLTPHELVLGVSKRKPAQLADLGTRTCQLGCPPHALPNSSVAHGVHGALHFKSSNVDHYSELQARRPVSVPQAATLLMRQANRQLERVDNVQFAPPLKTNNQPPKPLKCSVEQTSNQPTNQPNKPATHPTIKDKTRQD